MTPRWHVLPAAAAARCDERHLANAPVFVVTIHRRAYLRQALRRALGKRLGRDKG